MFSTFNILVHKLVKTPFKFSCRCSEYSLTFLDAEFCRTTYEHEKKVYRDHIESLQAMDKEYKSMADEVAKLRTELNNTSNVDKRSGKLFVVEDLPF